MRGYILVTCYQNNQRNNNAADASEMDMVVSFNGLSFPILCTWKVPSPYKRAQISSYSILPVPGNVCGEWKWKWSLNRVKYLMVYIIPYVYKSVINEIETNLYIITISQQCPNNGKLGKRDWFSNDNRDYYISARQNYYNRL